MRELRCEGTTSRLWIGCAEKVASSSIAMSGHGLEEGSREGKVAVLEEDGEVSELERLRLKVMLYIP